MRPGVRLVRERHPQLQLPIPPEVVVYEVDGPLFFGAAEKAMTAMHTIQREARIVVASETFARELGVTVEFLVSDTVSTPDQEVADQAFFRRYQDLKPDVKAKIKKFLEMWED